MTRWALGVEYDGSLFHGFQRQPHLDLPTVQGALETALTSICDHPVRLVCAGRTDAGVHATGQVIHFDTVSTREPRAWLRGGNSLTPAGIMIHWAQIVDDSFHARFAARWRRYVYLFTDRQPRQALLRDRIASIPGAVDIEAMQAAAEYLLGEQDFSSFRATHCQARHPVRDIHRARVSRHGDLVAFDVTANAFLQHMVRNLVGTLATVGRGEQPPEWVGAVLAARDRRSAAATAPPDGLYLVDVGYDEAHGLPPCREPLVPFGWLS